MSLINRTIVKPLGDDPPKAHLIYGQDLRESLKLIEPNSVQMVATSPPYWGLRDYGGDPGVWGGNADCEHEWGDMGPPHHPGQVAQTNTGGRHGIAAALGQTAGSGQFCKHCGAWRGHLGLEPTPREFAEHIVEVFEGIRRVLRKDGVVFLNLGDTYFGSSTSSANHKNFGRDMVDEGRWPKDRSAGGTNPNHKNIAWKAAREHLSTYDNLKPKDLVGVPWRVALALQDAGWYLRNDIVWSKCLSGGTRLYARTQKGEMPSTLKDLVRLDPATVQLWNGSKWTQVVRWMETPRPDGPLELELRSGERIGCTPDHRWPTSRGILRTDQLNVGDVISQTALPEPDVPCSPQHLPDDIGWFVGLYIAEGSRGGNGTIQIASHSDEMVRFRRLAQIADAYGSTCRMHKTGSPGGFKATINLQGGLLDGVLRMYVSGKTAKNKHLHPRAWGRSNTFLRRVLEGYLSGDGHFDAKANRWKLGFTKNDNWAADLRTLAGRLGASLRLRRAKHKFNGTEYPGWRGRLRWQPSEHPNAKADGEIVAIRGSRGRKFWDVTVKDEPHLFATASGLLTHNSNPMPESVRDRCTRSHEYIFLLAHPDSGGKYFFDTHAIKEGGGSRPQRERALEIFNQSDLTQDHLDAIRAVGSQDAGKALITQSGAGRNTAEVQRLADEAKAVLGGYFREFLSVPGGRNKRTVWNVNPKPYPGAHFAVWPEELVEPMVKAGSSEHGCCSKCRAPYKRVLMARSVENTGAAIGGYPARNDAGTRTTDPTGRGGNVLASKYLPGGWEATCGCEGADVVPCVVLDTFSGSATTGAVAMRLGRDYIGTDLQPDYLELATARLEGRKAPKNPDPEDQTPDLIGDLFG